MKALRLLATVLVAATGMALSNSCKPAEEPVVAPKIDVSCAGDKIEIPAAGDGQVTFTVTANKNWTLSKKDLSWVNISPVEGKADETVTVIILPSENVECASREGVITIQAEDVTKEIKVIQAAAAASLTIEGITDGKIVIDPTPSPVTFSIKSNVAWSIEKKDLDWLEISPASGSAGSQTVTLTAPINKVADREGSFTVKSDAGNKEIGVSQKMVDLYLKLGAESANIGSDGGETKLTVSSNIDWSAATTDTWLTIAPASGTGDNVSVTITAAENDGSEARTGTVTFTAGSLAPAVFTVTQEAPAPVDPVVLAQWKLPNDDDEYIIAHNPDWELCEDKSKCTTKWKLVAEDNTNIATWVLGNAKDAPATAYTRTHVSKGLLVCGIWTGDGFVFPAANVTAKKGRQIAFYTGIRASSADTPCKWGVKISVDGGQNWNEAELVLNYINKSNKLKNSADLTLQGDRKHDIMAHYKLPAAISGATVQAYVYCIDGSAACSGEVLTPEFEKIRNNIRFEALNEEINGTTYIGPTIVLE